MSVQNLLAALDDEYKAYSFYTFASAFGEPFVRLRNAENTHISALMQHLQNLNVEIPPNPYLNTMVLPNTLEEILQTAIANENANVQLYNILSAKEQNPEVLDVFYRLQAASFNNHLPALNNALLHMQTTNASKMQNTMEMLNQGKEILGETGEIVTKLQNGTLSQEQLEGFLNKLNYSLVGGLIAGAFGTIILNELLNQNKE